MTQNYINLARKYRPQIIQDLIGQSVLIQTLENAFALQKIAHAFMLTGIRGVGKTTTARIIAKALNCIGPGGKGEPTLAPCGVCEHCVAITSSQHMDVLEMDAASRTGVDDIREIIESAKYIPTSARYKIFIIDEVHMLSKNAFNALLKTLEEPSKHLKFIFATTEIRKVPITILSRCQTFTLKRVEVNIIQEHLQKICLKEGVETDSTSKNTDSNGLFSIAKSANGSVRDSLSLLDQAIVFTNKNITYANIESMLGKSNKEDVYNLLNALLNENLSESYSIFQNSYNNGVEVDLLLEDLLNALHNVIYCKTINNVSALELSDYEEKTSKELALIADLSLLIKVWQVIIQALEEVKQYTQSFQIVNVLINKIILVKKIGSIEKIIEKLNSNLIVNNNASHTSENTTTLISDNVKKNNLTEDLPVNYSDYSESTIQEPKNIIVSSLDNKQPYNMKPDEIVNVETIKNKVKKVFPNSSFSGETNS